MLCNLRAKERGEVDVHLRPEPLVQRGSRVDDSLHSAGGWRVRGGMAHYIATATTKQPDLPSNSNLPSPAPGLAALIALSYSP